MTKTKKPDSNKQKKELGTKLDDKKKISNENPVSLHHIGFGEAMAALLTTVDEDGKPVKAKPQAGKDLQS